jgi:2-methylisocitrate lyase-like PEP mutase family enzyme
MVLTPLQLEDVPDRVGISAHVALQAGAQCLYMTGAGTTASMLGEPDLGIATLTDFVQNGSMIVRVAKGVPVICGWCPRHGESSGNGRRGYRFWRAD